MTDIVKEFDDGEQVVVYLIDIEDSFECSLEREYS